MALLLHHHEDILVHRLILSVTDWQRPINRSTPAQESVFRRVYSILNRCLHGIVEHLLE